MVQKIFGLGLGATGIVGVLIVAGAILKGTGISAGAGSVGIGAGITIGIILGVLGIVGVLKRLVWVIIIKTVKSIFTNNHMIENFNT